MPRTFEPLVAPHGSGGLARLVAALTLIGAVGAAAPAHAQVEHGQPARAGDRVATYSRVSLEPVRPSELLGGETGLALSMGRWRVVGPAVQGLLRSEVARRVPALWRLRLDSGQPAALDVTCTVIGADGRPGRLTSLDYPDAAIAVTARALPPSVVDRDDAGIIVEGSAELTLGLDATRVAGRYAGTLTVTVNQL
jgi:hypothetical protein